MVYLKVLDLLDNHLDALHDHILGGPFHGDFIDFCNLLMTSSSSSGDFFLGLVLCGRILVLISLP